MDNIANDGPYSLVTRSNSEFDVGQRIINGVDYKVFVNAPDNLRELFEIKSQQFKERELLIFQNERYTYEDFQLKVNIFAQSLREKCKVKTGDRVAIIMRNYPEYLISVMAISSIGGVVVFMNAWWTASEIEFALLDSGASLAIVDGPRQLRLKDCNIPITVPTISVRDAYDCDFSFDQLILDPIEASPPLCLLAAEDDFAVMYTSGSTGHPKGVVLTHRSVISALWTWLMITGPDRMNNAGLDDDKPLPVSTGQDTEMITVPLFHVAGINTCFLLRFCQGAKIVMMEKWNAAEAIRLIEKERVTRFWGVPTMLQDLFSEAENSNVKLSSLTSIDSGGAKRPPDHVARMTDRFPNTAPSTGYGMTETSGLGLRLAGIEFIENPDAAGYLLPPIQEMRIIDDDGKTCSPEQVGELLLKSPANMRAYLNRPDDTATVLCDGWLRTGDLAKASADGLVSIVDRKKDIIIRAGENVACLEVEAAIYRHPSVIEACVFSIPDYRLGEVVGAAIVVKVEGTLKAEDLFDFLSEKLASFKIPEKIWIFTDALPRGFGEKIDKRATRTLCLDQRT